MKIDLNFKELLDEYYYLKKENEDLVQENTRLLIRILELEEVESE